MWAMTSLQSLAANAASAEPTAGDPGLAQEVPVVVARIRVGITSLAVGAYVVAMAAITLMAMSAAPTSPTFATGVLVVAGAAMTITARTLMRSALRHADELAWLGADLVDRYDRARLDAILDPLTGLGNHRAFQEELDRAAAMAQRHGQATALLLMDVDDLKRTNDTEGHAAGDEVLRAVARLIVTNCRRIDRAFRIGGDEFAVLTPASSLPDALTLGRRILAMALDPQVRGGQPPISLTIGISAIPRPSADRHVLYRNADAALYWGKRHGRTDVLVYDPKLHGVADDERPSAELASAIDRVVAEHLLKPVYQPVYALRDGTCVGFEGLVRPSDGAGFRNASALFVAAESVSRTVELDLAAIRALAAAARSLGPEQYLAVNLSPRTVEAVAFNPHEVLGVLGRVGIDPRRVVIELTEREAIEDMDRLARNLAVFRRTGARIAADDVGAGNAGLQLLSRIDFDVIKIDLSLVHNGAVLAPSRSVLRALIEMAQRRGATTVAEGLETSIQLEAVRDLGIQVGQGYLLGRPAEKLDATSIDIEALLPDTDLDANRSDPPAA
jgi:diguanylate cyclase (GGDEF)-like protein